MQKQILHVIVISITKKGTPKVKPLKGDSTPILPPSAKDLFNKNMSWSKTRSCWRVFDHNTEIFEI